MSNQIVKALEHAAQKIGGTLAKDAGKAVKDFYHSAGNNLKKVAENTAEADAKHAAELRRILDGGKKDLPHEPRMSGGGVRAGGRPGKGEPSLGGPSKPGQASHGNRKCQTAGDPVDVVSGQMIMSKTDLELPGALPLAIRRSYASGYLSGRHFGPGWSSTLDQRVQIDDQGIHCAGEDAEILHYPRPVQPGQKVMPTDGARWPLTWEQDDDVIRIEDAEAGWIRHFAAIPGEGATRPLSAVTDRNGHRIDYLYDDSGLPTEIHHSGGYRVAVDVIHTAAGPRIEALRLLDGTNRGLGTTVMTYGYDARGRLAEIINSTGTPLVYSYDADDRITSWTDRNGFWYAYEYGVDGRVIRGHGSNGALAAAFDYDEQNRVTTATNSLGHRTRYHYDRYHHLTKVVDPAGNTVYTDHDRYGRLLSHTDQLGRTTRYTLDIDGEIVHVDHPDGTHMSVRYNNLRLPIEVETPDGAIWRQTYDHAGNRIALTDPAGVTTRFGYDEAGHLSSVTDALGHTTQVRDNAAGLVIEVIDPVGGRTAYHRDAFGRPIAVTDPLEHTTHYTWTVEGRLISQVTADGAAEVWTYDAEGNTLSHTDQIGAVTAMEYTHFDLLAARTGPDGARYTFTYDTELQLTGVTNPQGLTWTYAYAPTGQAVAETDFNGSTLSCTFDAAGQLISRTNALGQTVTYSYDAMGNMVSKNADGRTATYGYDRAGRLIQASIPGVELNRVHDNMGRLTAETINGRTLDLAYDVLGRRTSRRTPSGAETAWSYDPAGGVCSISASGHAVTFERDLAGREMTRRIGPDLTLATTWDGLHRLTAQALTHGSGKSLLQHRAYTYCPNGALTAITDQHTGTSQFTLDRVGRVTSVQAANWTEAYAYDDLGNLTDATWPTRRDEAAQGGRTYHGTLIRTAGRTSYQHDEQGRVITRKQATISGRIDTWCYTWDAEDRLASVTTPDGSRWQYLYDPFGRRIAKQHVTGDGDGAVVTEWTDFTWDGPTLAEQTAHSPALPGPYTLTWDHHGYHPVAQTERLVTPEVTQDEIDRRFFAIITDLVGTPTHLLNPDGTTAWQARTALWGATTQPRTSITSTPLRFPGQYYDPETRLHYNHHRYYDPTTARYLTPDPLGLAPAPNPHTYVDNPHTWIDPFGLAAEHNPVFNSRREAFNAARDMAGIPRGNQPIRQWTIGGDPKQQHRANYVYRPYDPKGDPNKDPRAGWGRYYQYETPQGARVIAEHTSDARAPYPHFHAGKAPEGEPRDVNMQGRPYKQILPKHHIYYNQSGCDGK
ncbi:DUF6531 domain-containing protein [Kitasatospora sp. GP82]|uniref:DUF6531 domain-containing protein n=1 Tax=Kitasatospora sp. GP82 TaxID=3035089 RepID=UPI002474A588|nr:DUF6531 domain-containing protein [Kitasatospora sp. GP82]MDH6123661.1 RHS repeat-associated protein [Kitasatospora sp. GP82]